MAQLGAGHVVVKLSKSVRVVCGLLVQLLINKIGLLVRMIIILMMMRIVVLKRTD